jgi:hypothetical protein
VGSNEFIIKEEKMSPYCTWLARDKEKRLNVEHEKDGPMSLIERFREIATLLRLVTFKSF